MRGKKSSHLLALPHLAYSDHSGTPADTINYNLLLRDLRMELDELGRQTEKEYGLTAALPCGTTNIVNIDIEWVAQYLSESNLMTYGTLVYLQNTVAKHF